MAKYSQQSSLWIKPCFKSYSEDVNIINERNLTFCSWKGNLTHGFSVLCKTRTKESSSKVQPSAININTTFSFQFGCLLVECFLKSAHINVNLFNDGPEKILPAFYHTYEFNNDKRFGILKPHPIVCKLFKGYLAKQGEISMETTSVPMLVPPRPWRATKDGAYLILPGARFV